MSRIWRRMLALLVLATATSVGPAAAQDVQYRTVTKLEMKGALGRVMSLASRLGGGAPEETVETTSIKGGLMRTDAGDASSTIIDIEAGRFIMLNHEQKTYTVVTLEMMAQAMDSLGRAMSGAQQAQSPAAGAAEPAQGGRTEFSFDLKVDRTGERKKIAGADAERTLITILTDIQYTPEGEEEAEEAGTLVVLADQWNSTELEAWQAMQQFYERAPAAFAREASTGGAAFAAQPGMAEAMAKAAEEAKKLEGMEVLSTSYMVMVPPAVEFDRALALNEKPEEEAGGGGAGNLARGALRGLLGGRREEPKQEEEPKPAQATLMVITTELKDVKTGSLPASLFQVPDGYREVTFTMGGGTP